MAGSNVISGLVRRRRELTGEMIACLARADDLAASIEALDKTLRLFDPDIRLDAIPALQSRPRPDWAIQGEMVRLVFGILRTAGEPVATADLTATVNERRGIEGAVTRLHLKRVRRCLDRQKARGRVQAVRVNGVVCWTLAANQAARCQ